MASLLIRLVSQFRAYFLQELLFHYIKTVYQKREVDLSQHCQKKNKKKNPPPKQNQK